MSLLDRIRQFWRSAPPPDHAFTEEERDEQHPLSAYDEVSREASDFVGDDFDPDDQRETR